MPHAVYLRGMSDAPVLSPAIYVDADACPVKEEVYRVARRVGLDVHVVANSFIRTPMERCITFVLVDAGPDVADDWIAERVGPGDIAITADIPLAARCVKQGARAIGPSGHPFTEDSIGDTLATRNLMTSFVKPARSEAAAAPSASRTAPAFYKPSTPSSRQSNEPAARGRGWRGHLVDLG
jgi:uncharacterized protein YaiI (UPF0178 family)